MAIKNQVIENPQFGIRFIVRRPADESEGQLLEIEEIHQPGARGPVSHIHPLQEETWTVLEGLMGTRLAARSEIVTSGNRVVIPAGTPHRLWNAGDDVLRVRTEFRPALNTETFFETACGLVSDGKTDRRGFPNPLQMAVMADEFRATFRLATIPGWVQGPVFRTIAVLGRRLGYRAWYPEYSPAGPVSVP